MNKESKEGQLFLYHISFQDILRVGFFVASYFIAFQIAYLFPDSENILLAIWPASGIGLAALLLSPRRLWSVILASFFIVGNVSNLIIERPLFNSMGFMIANVVESYGCAWFIVRWCGENIRFNTVKEISALIFGAIFVNAGTAVIGGGTAWAAGISPFFSFWKFWWIADGLGILILAPLFVAWGTLKDISIRDQWKLITEGGIFMLIWYGISKLSFQLQRSNDPFSATPYLLVALLSYAAIRLGQRGVTVALAILSVIAITSEAMSTGPSPLGGNTMNDRLLLLQVFLSCIAVTGYIVAASYSESRSSERLAREEQSRIRTLGDNIPDGMIFQIVREKDGSTRLLYLSAGIEKLDGISANEVMRDPSKVQDLIVEEDLPKIAAAFEASTRDLSILNTVMRLKRPDGQLRWMQLSASPRSLEDGRILWDGIQIDITERRKAEEEAILNSEIFKNVSEGIYLLGMEDGRIKHANSKFEQMFGYGPGEMVGMDVSIVNAPSDKTPHETKMEIMDILRKSGEWHGEVKNIRKDGTPFWSYANVSLFDHPQYGRVVVSVHTDITERKRIQEELQVALIKYKTLFFAFPLGITVADGTGKIIETNPMAEQLLGLAEEEHRRRKIDGQEWKIIRSDGTPFPAKEYASTIALAENRVVENVEMGIVKTNSEITWINVTAAPLPLEGGGIVITYNNITERKNAEMEREQYYKFFQISNDMMVISEPGGRFRKINPACMQTLGYSETELLAKPFIDFVHPGDRQPTLDEIALQLQRGFSMNFENRYICKDGTYRWLSWRANYNKDEGLTYATARDITDSKQKEEALRSSLEEKTVLLNEVHHRVKNNLQIVSSLLSLQAMRTKNKEALDTLLETGNRVFTMALLHETLYRSGNMAKLSFSSYIDNICVHIIRSYGKDADNIKLEQHLADIEFDLDKAVPCGLIITELVSNALKHAFPKGQNGRIIVELQMLPDHNIMLKVADNGIGLPPGLDISKSETLGLKLVSILAEKLKGSIEIIRDKGTTFQITFRTKTDEEGQS